MVNPGHIKEDLTGRRWLKITPWKYIYLSLSVYCGNRHVGISLFLFFPFNLYISTSGYLFILDNGRQEEKCRNLSWCRETLIVDSVTLSMDLQALMQESTHCIGQKKGLITWLKEIALLIPTTNLSILTCSLCSPRVQGRIVFVCSYEKILSNTHFASTCQTFQPVPGGKKKLQPTSPNVTAGERLSTVSRLTYF